MRDYYSILKVARTATSLEIKNAYRQIALAVHPDVSARGDEASETVTTSYFKTLPHPELVLLVK